MPAANAQQAQPDQTRTFRVATFNADLARRGPGVLLRDILRGKDAQIDAVVAVIGAADPDILLLTGIDYDLSLAALGALRDRLNASGQGYGHIMALRPNTGMQTGLDLDRDGRIGGPGDAQGYGRFSGEGGMAILSRFPIAPDHRDLSGTLWKDLPGNIMPKAFYPGGAADVLRLPTTGHWDIGIDLGARRLRLLSYYASPPVFDGPEDRNGRRNHDETQLWQLYLDGKLGPPPQAPFVILGDANLDPVDGDGRGRAMRALLARRDVQDPRPSSPGGAEAAALQGGANRGQGGDPALDTADWKDEGGPGNLRVDYVLPSSDLVVLGAGVVWPLAGDSAAKPPAPVVAAASRHRLVWVDLALPEG